MNVTRLFSSNRTQAVRLAKDVAFPADVREVEIVVAGRSRVITPSGTSWEHWFADGAPVTDDFAIEREQPADQERGEL
ncbi:MAG: type II toxin-antitoxin system VapB family antitoxin [Pseudolysinimonas sp.]